MYARPSSQLSPSRPSCACNSPSQPPKSVHGRSLSLPSSAHVLRTKHHPTGDAWFPPRAQTQPPGERVTAWHTALHHPIRRQVCTRDERNTTPSLLARLRCTCAGDTFDSSSAATEKESLLVSGSGSAGGSIFRKPAAFCKSADHQST